MKNINFVKDSLSHNFSTDFFHADVSSVDAFQQSFSLRAMRCSKQVGISAKECLVTVYIMHMLGNDKIHNMILDSSECFVLPLIFRIPLGQQTEISYVPFTS